MKNKGDYADRDKRASIDAAGICLLAILIIVLIGFVHYVFWE
jgi:hypothetical protein